MPRSDSRTRPFLTVLLAFVLVGAGGAAAAIFFADETRRLFTDDPPRADYSWLRRELSNVGVLTGQGLRGARRSGRLAAAKALEQAILSSRASARSTGTQPIPLHIREPLQDYFPEDMLDEVRWAFPNKYLDLGSLVAWYKAEGGAVTLQDTIVYASRVGLESEHLWAHELTHVLQYRELGLADFARVYAINPELLERQARQNADRIIGELRARRAAPSRSLPQPPTGVEAAAPN